MKTAEEQHRINQQSLASIDYRKVDWKWEKKHHEQMHKDLQKAFKESLRV